MEMDFYLCFIICAILSHVIGLSEENVEKRSQPHIRRKRIINLMPGGSRSVSLQEIPYIVNIYAKGKSECSGAILAPHIIVTAAHCVYADNVTYAILSGSQFIDRGIQHRIIRKIINPHFKDHLLPHDVALLVISPLIDFILSRNRKINIHEGSLPPGTLATFSGWGITHIIGNIPIRPRDLRSIRVPVISLDDCQELYGLIAEITIFDICTYDRLEVKGGSFGDSGGPLVVDNHLVGVMSWSSSVITPDYPDVFVNLSNPLYMDWIMTNMRVLGISEL